MSALLPLSRLCRNEEETLAVGRELGEQFASGGLISLEGDLGAGKTVLVRGLAEGLGLDPSTVTSPSFVLAIEHAGSSPPLLHVDLYRLPEGGGLEDLGIEEALAEGWIVAIEWGERLPEFLRRAAWRVMVTIPPSQPDGTRVVTALPPEENQFSR